MNVHEDTIAQPPGFCMQSRSCPSLTSSGIAFHSPGPREQSALFAGRDLGLVSNRPDVGDA